MIRKTKSSNVMNIFKITVASGFPKYKKRAQIMYRNLYLLCPRSLRQHVKIHGGFTLGRADADTSEADESVRDRNDFETLGDL